MSGADSSTLPQPPAAAALTAWRRLEQRIDRAFGAAHNPLRQLGALAMFMLALLLVSGVWLYAALDTSASGAYSSIERLSAAPWSAGAIMRSVHRYATDAFVLLVALHGLRELVHGHWRHFRRFVWLTGCALLPLAAVSAIGGFWLNWDQLGQFSAVATAEWLDALPLFAQPFARNFITNEGISDRLFSLFLFVHLGLPLLLLFGLWFHLQRLSRAVLFPPRALAGGVLASLVVLALVQPVASQAPADLTTVPIALSLDWIVLSIHPLMYATSPATTWVLAGLAFALLFALPFVPGPKPAPVAVVDAANCNGCRRCFADCPYAAITMAVHPLRGHAREIAVVDPDLCASCGICAGACPSATPFRSGSELAGGIDMPQLTVAALRRQLHRGIADSGAAAPVVVFGCREGADLAPLAAPDVLVLSLICAGQLAPSFVEYALRDGAGGVLVASCRDGGCEYRLGARWTAERLQAAREPRLRKHVPRARVELVHADRGEEAAVLAALTALRVRLHAADERQRRGSGHG
jgi:ferredoxin/coenzyme F420-reducing hydrogenase delta subunit